MENSNSIIFSKYKNERSLLNKINDTIVIVTILAMVIWITITYIQLGNDGISGDITNSVIGDVFVIPIMALAALAGVISVVASNNKMPITLLVLSSIATIYKLLYSVVQMSSGQGAINSTVIIGQSIAFFTLIIQVYFWIRWNRETNENKFITQSFKGWRTLIAVSLILVIWILQLLFSIWFNGTHIQNVDGSVSFSVDNFTFWDIFMDWSGSVFYTTASILMAFGNIFCFVFFILSDLNWLYWTITDVISANNSLMIAMAITTMIQAAAYTLLAITGLCQWFLDDFEIYDKYKIRRVERK